MGDTFTDDLKGKVVRQIEFYFSDSNLPKDKFLKERIAEDPNGFVPLNVICAFQRMRDLIGVKSQSPDAVPADKLQQVAEALAGSESLEVDESKTKVKRKQPLAPEAEIAKAVDARSLYARPFPMDATVDTITELFNGHGTVNCVRMRRHVRSKMFKGSVFVEFSSVEEAEKVLAKAVEFAGATLRLQKKNDYLEGKRKARKAAGGHNVGYESDDSNAGQGLPDGAGGEVGGEVVESAKAKIREAPKSVDRRQGQGQKRKQEAPEYDEGDLGEGPRSKRPKQEGEEAGAAAGDEDMGEGDGEGEEEEAPEPAEPTFTPGCLISFTLEAELPELTGPRVISDVLGGRDKVKFVELLEGRKGGFLRFATPELAAAALAEFEGRPEDERAIAGIKGTMTKTEGDDEVNYYKRAQAAHAAKEARNGGGGGGGRGGFRGGRGGFRGGRGGRGGRDGGRGRGRGGRGRGRGRGRH
ncbi:hypothetical protein CHLRE_17g724200v5 [Chlamydomonas reinhardtii]|uniref:Lupus La protein n=1 Tax=Chlamydomonas reinhardtii TaxID=3055 RepID=A0A2K3CQH8_CHLRE|nr:uncharacterized protein CHLRE_17g724200v5 [Chlamydomonas reinhardtii]PNW70541.1 hypothetical protein CHLRE_17g724200v5 [Chlamydomonas reinhardtii]